MRSRVLVLTVLAVAALLLLLQRHPLRLAAQDPEEAAVFPAANTGHPILLAVDPALFQSDLPRTAKHRPPDLEWLNILGQVFGGCDLVESSELESAPEFWLEGRSLLVIPRMTLARLDSVLAPQFESRMSDGLVLLLEAPEGHWARRLGLRDVRSRVAEQLTWPVDERLAEAFGERAADLGRQPAAALELAHEIVDLRPSGEVLGIRPVASPFGRPLIWWRPQGKGGAWIHGLDLARLSLNLRQGIPADDFRLPQRYHEVIGDRASTSQLVATGALLESDHAWLDALLHVFLGPASRPAPWPTVWPAPFDADGWLLLTLDGGEQGHESPWRLLPGADTGLDATLYLDASDGHPSQEVLAEMIADDIDLGFRTWMDTDQSWKDPQSPKQRIGFGKFWPAARPLSLERQRESLGERLQQGQLLQHNRSRGLLWPEEVDTGWRRLAAAGLRSDSSHGPAPGASGWIFGSGFPHHPLSRRGLVYSIWELPFLSTLILGELDRDRITTWLGNNAAGGHGAVLLRLRPDALSSHASRGRSEFWQDLSELAQQHAHRSATLNQLLDFSLLRGTIHLRPRFDGKTLSVEISIPTDAVGIDDFAVALPARWRGQTLVGWQADWNGAASRRAYSYDESVRLIRLSPGRSRISADYR